MNIMEGQADRLGRAISITPPHAAPRIRHDYRLGKSDGKLCIPGGFTASPLATRSATAFASATIRLSSNGLTGQAMPHDRVGGDRAIDVKPLRACIQKHACAWRADAQMSRWRNYCCPPRSVRVYGRRPAGPAENNGPFHASDGEGGARSCSLRERAPSPPEGPCGRANAPMRRELWRRMDSPRARETRPSRPRGIMSKPQQIEMLNSSHARKRQARHCAASRVARSLAFAGDDTPVIPLGEILSD
jgi:hypothetical protein